MLFGSGDEFWSSFFPGEKAMKLKVMSHKAPNASGAGADVTEGSRLRIVVNE